MTTIKSYIIRVGKRCRRSKDKFDREKNWQKSRPAPSTYHLKSTIGMPKTTDPTLWQSPAYSFRHPIDRRNNVPGPGPAYKVDRMTRHGREPNDKVHIGRTLNTDEIAKSPGPAAYLPCYSNLKRAPTPKFLFPLKDGGRFAISPGPNAYMLRKIYDDSPSVTSRRKGYTIKWRTEYRAGQTGAESPGPAAYGAVNADVYKNRDPPRTFGVHTDRTGRRSSKAPGPWTYDISGAGCAEGCRRKFTFGTKHSRKCLPYVVPADNSL